VAPPVVADQKAFTVDAEAQVTAFSVADGSRVWRTALTPSMREEARKFWQIGRIDPAQVGFGGGVAYDDGRVFLTSGFGFAAALDAESGETEWQVDLPGIVRNPPTAADGRVFAITTSNQIIALDQSSGETLWTHESFEESARFLSTGSVAVQGDVVVAPFSSGEVVALDATTGRVLWSATVSRTSRLNALSNLNDIAGSPVIDRGGVFAVSHSGQLSAIDARTGRVAWEKPVGGLNMPWVSGDYLFVVTNSAELLALSRQDGAVVWKQQLDTHENMKKKKKPITWSGPILAGDRLRLVSSEGQLVDFSTQDGERLASYKLGAPSTIPPIVAEGAVFVITEKGRLEAWR
jgi:outer membrane protein assembly factor BamB